jgi:hypothetical protein
VNRKQRRDAVRTAKKEGKDLQDALSLMGALPSACLTCQTAFDRADKEQVKTWQVVVREKEAKVHIYCPSCWALAESILKEFKERIKNK